MLTGTSYLPVSGTCTPWVSETHYRGIKCFSCKLTNKDRRDIAEEMSDIVLHKTLCSLGRHLP